MLHHLLDKQECIPVGCVPPTYTLSPAYKEHFDAKKSARCSRVLVVTKLIVAGILLIVQCSYQGTILSHLMSTNH